jgi:UPF0271 protein
MTHQKNNEMKIQLPKLVFDTNIFLTGIDFNLIEGIIYTTPNIIEEIDVKKYSNKNQNVLNKIYVALERKKLVIKTAEAKYLEEVIKKSKITGDYGALSNADIELIALALELFKIDEDNVILFSNDYSLENVSSELKIPFYPLFKEGIQKKIIWEIYCPNCKIIHDADDLYRNCETCGMKLKRRPKTIMRY